MVGEVKQLLSQGCVGLQGGGVQKSNKGQSWGSMEQGERKIKW